MKEEFSKPGCLSVTIFLILFWLLLILSLCSCEKQEANSTGLPPQSQPVKPHIPAKSGSVIFFIDYTNSKAKISPLMVSTPKDTTCNRNIGTITAFPEGYPPCGSFWGKTVTDTIEYIMRYRVTAALNGKTLYASGSTKLTPDQCNQVKIVLK